MSAPVMTSERRRMRELFAGGMTRRAIAKRLGRHENTVSMYVHPIALNVSWAATRRKRMSNAQRIERLYADCNRVLAEAAR